MTQGTAPVPVWFRRDLWLSDHPALAAATATGRPVVPVFVHDETAETLGAAPKWRLGEGLGVFAAALAAGGSRLVLRRAAARGVLLQLVAETGAAAAHWSRVCDPAGIARDTAVKAALKATGVAAESFPGAVLFEPWTVMTGRGRPYAVFSAFWRAVRDRDPGAVLAAPRFLSAPADWPASDRLADWRMAAVVARGAAVLARHATVGEAAAQVRLDAVVTDRLARHAAERDFPAQNATSGLSEPLARGEISPRTIRTAAMRARGEGNPGAEKSCRSWPGATSPGT